MLWNKESQIEAGVQFVWLSVQKILGNFLKALKLALKLKTIEMYQSEISIKLSLLKVDSLNDKIKSDWNFHSFKANSSLNFP